MQGGAVLARNLLAAMQGQALEAFRPKAQVLSLIDGGRFGAMAHWRGFSWEGPGLRAWKAWLDDGFLRHWQQPALR